MENKSQRNPISLFRWIWRSYISTALIPLVLVEMVFVGIYFFANAWCQREMIGFLRDEVNTELSQIADLGSSVIQQQLADISNITELYRAQTEKALKNPAAADKEDLERLKHSPDRAYYTFSDRNDGGAAVFYSGYFPIGEEERKKVERVLTLQQLMKDITNSHPLVASIYLNTFDSLNVIYPYFDVISQYATHMNIPSYNFYYEADIVHNPEKKIKWTNAYLDPAGHGWMTSAIAPVYNSNFLEGVVGIDVTISTITKQILKMDIPWKGYGVLVGKDGTILALPQAGEKDWGLNELTEHHYDEAILKDTFKPDKFNIYNNQDTENLAKQVSENMSGFSAISLGNEKQAVRWATIKETGWKLLIIAPEKNIYSSINQMNKKLFNIGTFMIGGLILFYTVFFLVLWRRAHKMSLNISRPLLNINKIIHKIGNGDYHQDMPALNVKELQNTALNIVNMGIQLGRTNNDLLKTQEQLKKREADLEILIKSEVKARAEAEKASMAKSQFLSSMSHELRTPLNAVLGFAQILQIDPSSPLSQNQERGVKEIMKAGSHLLTLINEILDLSKIESGKVTISIESVHIISIMEETSALIKPFAEQHGIKLHTSCNECREYFVLADQTRIKQVLINLLSNAVKYNKPNGEIKFYCEKIDNLIRFNIIDSGHGIAERDIDTIFKPFHRLHNNSFAIEGTGIGLTVSKQLVELMGGKIFVESKEGEGSRFCIEMPCAVQNNDAADIHTRAALLKAAVKDDSQHSILYVEDNVPNLNLMESVISHIPNVKMLSATSGEIGIDLARAHKPDLILMDIDLPGIDGYEVFKKLMQYEETKGIPVIAVSANAMQKHIDKGLDMGFIDYIIKPIDVADFIKKLSNVLSSLKK